MTNLKKYNKKFSLYYYNENTALSIKAKQYYFNNCFMELVAINPNSNIHIVDFEDYKKYMFTQLMLVNHTTTELKNSF